MACPYGFYCSESTRVADVHGYLLGRTVGLSWNQRDRLRFRHLKKTAFSLQRAGEALKESSFLAKGQRKRGLRWASIGAR